MSEWTICDFNIEDGVLLNLELSGQEKLDELGFVEIPEGVVEIAPNVFSDFIIREVYLPKTLEIIGNYAFNACCVKKVYGGENVLNIKEGAFRENQITSLKNFKNVKEIGMGAFNDCRLREFLFPASLKRIGMYAFSSNDFKEIDLNETKNLEIADSAFSENMIKKVILGENSRIAPEAFKYNELQEVVNGNINDFKYGNINEKVESKEASFSDIWTEDDFVIALDTFEGLTDRGVDKLQKLESITFPTIHGVDKISSKFSNRIRKIRKLMKSVYISEGVKVIEGEAFKESGIETIHFPDTLKEIKELAFYRTNLTNVELPSLEVLGAKVFLKSKIQKIDMKKSLIKRIVLGCFEGCKNLKEVILPESLDVIGGNAFRNTASLKSIVIPKNVKEIANYAFNNSRLEEIDFVNPEKLEEIGECAFERTRIKHFPFTKLKKLSSLGANAFLNGSLEDVKIDSKALSILGGTFRLNPVKNVELNVYDIDYIAFAMCDIENVKIKEAYDIKMNAFSYSDIKRIKIEKLEKMSNEAFDKAVVEDLDIPDNTKIYKEIKIG